MSYTVKVNEMLEMASKIPCGQCGHDQSVHFIWLDDLAPCLICGCAKWISPLATPAPAHPFEVTITIGADDWEYVQRVMHELAQHIGDRDPSTAPMISGGAGGGHGVTVAQREIRVNAYHLELEQWMERRRVANEFDVALRAHHAAKLDAAPVALKKERE